MIENSKILIVEDEQIIAENLRFILQEKGYNFVDVAIDVDETKDLFKKNTYDLVLMDINLGEYSDVDGVDLIIWLTKKYDFSFLYVTANADEKTVEKAKTTKPSGYIIKPFVNASIYANVAIVLNAINKEKYFHFINNGIPQKTLISEITYMKSEGVYVIIHLLNGHTQLIRTTLSECLEKISSPFIRIHKSIIVNKNHVIGYTSTTVSIKETNDLKLSLGRTYKPVFLEKIKDLSFS